MTEAAQWEAPGLTGRPVRLDFSTLPPDLRRIMDVPDIVIVSGERIASPVLQELVSRFFEDMVKYVVDVERGIAAVRGITVELIGKGDSLE